MTLLLDAHAVLWFVEHAPQFSPRTKAAIKGTENSVVYTVVSGV